MSSGRVQVAIYILTSALGVAAFLYPFWLPAVRQSSGANLAHGNDAPLLLTLLVAVCFSVLLLEVQGQSMNAKTAALLGVLTASNSLLRFAEVAFPVPGGFSPIFVLIVTCGYVFGARFGFLLGAMTLLVSSFVTGSAGPWLPYQMFVAGWAGMAAPLCRPPVRWLGGEGTWRESIVLAFYGGVWGLLYGAVMNIWFWPFIAGPESALGSMLYWEAGIGVADTVRRYLSFYLVTSLAWDMLRMAGNFLLLAFFGTAVVRILRRFHRRFVFTYDMTGVTAAMETDVIAGIQSTVEGRA